MSRAHPTVSLPLALVLAACSTNEHRALRTWTLLRLVDCRGTGHLRRSEAVAGLRALGVSKSAAHVWVADLGRSRYAELRYSRRCQETVLVLTSIGAVHTSYGVTDRRRDVELPANELVRSRGLKRLFGLAGATLFTGPAARATRATVLGVSPSSQRRGEQGHGAIVVPHYVVHNRAPDADPDSLPAIDGARVFISGDKILERGANTVHAPFPVIRRSRRRHSASLATAEPTASRPQRQHFASEQALKRHSKRYGTTPNQGYTWANPEDRRLFVRLDPEPHHRFGRRIHWSRVAEQPTALRRQSMK